MLMISSVNAGIVASVAGEISQISTWNEAESSLLIDGDTLIKISTGITACPQGVYVQHSDYSPAVLSIVLSSYMSNNKIAFQVWDDSSRFWKGSGVSYCQVRAVVLRK